MSDPTERILKSEIVFNGNFLRIQRDETVDAKGHHRKTDFILHPGAVLVIPCLDRDRIVIERQYRHPLRRVFWEFPAGKLDPGEHSVEAARRELREETGFECAELIELGRIHNAIGYSNEFIDLFVARGLTQKGAQLDEGEELEVIEMTWSDLEDRVRAGEVTDAKTLAAFFWFDKYRRGEWK